MVWSGMTTSLSCSWEGGTAMAEAWLEVASLAYERLLPAAVAVAEGPPVGQVLPLNPKRGRRAPAPLAVCPDHPAEVLRHVEVLAGALMGFRAMRPTGELTQALKAEWEASCRRREHLVTSSERATISNALKTCSAAACLWRNTRERWNGSGAWAVTA